MKTLQKLKLSSILKWGSSIPQETQSKSNLYNFYTTTTTISNNNNDVFNSRNLGELAKKSRLVRKEAQAALLDYFHSTRNLQFMDAENMSKNTPHFFENLVEKVEIDDDNDIGKSVRRFLRYHPINEFEPFFESIGLKNCEFDSFLPRSSVFLHDNELLLENYYVLCNYGVPRNRIGKIYKEARDVFGFDYGVLNVKLKSLEMLGLRQSLVVKFIASSPCLLRKDYNVEEFVEVLGKLKEFGVGNEWLEENVREGDSYNWKVVLDMLFLLSKTGLSDDELGVVIMKHPDLLNEVSGCTTFRLFGFLLKFGLTKGEMKQLFLEFPEKSVVRFMRNLCHCYESFVWIKMSPHDIGTIVRSYPTMLGSCELKKVKSLLCILNCGTNRLRQKILDDPEIIKTWVLGNKLDSLAEPNRLDNVRMLKIAFLLKIGFVENSKEMEKALKVFRGRGLELQERFDCLVEAGLSREEVIAMLKSSPQILNQNKDVIKTKIEFFVDLGYSVTDLLNHPPIVSYAIERVKLRLLAYKWLREQMVVHPKLALSTLLSCSDKIFMRTYMKCHPRGHEYWDKLKKQIYFEAQ